MLRSRVGVLCLAAAACGFASISQETAAAAIRTMNDGFVATSSTEPVPKRQVSDLLEREASIPVPSQEDADGLQQATSSAVRPGELAAKVLALADAYPTKRPRGTRTALLGLAGLLLFLALHGLTQAAHRAPFNEDILFKHNSGRVKFAGAGLIISFALFAAGLAEVILAPGPIMNRNATSGFSFPVRGAKQAVIGRNLILMSAAAITLGWIIGFPQFIMMAGTIGFLAGFALKLLGLGLMFSDMKRGADLARKLYALSLKDRSATGEHVKIDPGLLIQLIDHALGSEEIWESFLAGKGLPFTEALQSAGQPGSKKEGKQFNTGAKQTGALLNADTLAAVAQQLQKLEQQQQQEGSTRDTHLHELVNAVVQASQEFQKHPEILQQATQLPQQLEMMPEGSAAGGKMAPLVESLAEAAEEAVSAEEGSGSDGE